MESTFTVDRRSALMDPKNTPVTWMTEPAGGFYGQEGSMPRDVHCLNPCDVVANSNDEVKSRIKRWIRSNTP